MLFRTLSSQCIYILYSHASYSILAPGTLKNTYRTYWGTLTSLQEDKYRHRHLFTIYVLSYKYQRLTWHIDTLLVYGELCWLSLQDQVASGWKQRLVVCVMSVTGWIASTVATRILICTYKLRTTSHILPPLRIVVSRNPGHPFAEPSFRYTAVSYLRKKKKNTTQGLP
jgi:hypothetical protein